MNLHEYQAKKLFAEYALPVSKGYTVESVEEAFVAIDKIPGNAWVVKAQVHAGGRGKAGGVKLVKTKEEAASFVKKMIGSRLVTFQTDADGQPVNKILIESCTDIAKELYLSAVVDRAQQCIVFMCSTEGGVEIEEVAKHTPNKIFKECISPIVGPQPYQGRKLAFKLGLQGAQIRQFTKIFLSLARLFQEKDLALLEINPLVITQGGDLHCLDAKISVDSNGLYRQPRLLEWRDFSQEDPREAEALEWELNYVALEGNIGCMVNGAGLAMATMDIVKLHGGQPANFLDVGGGATKERVAEAFKIILSDHAVKGVFVNIFGGIVRCDMIADGIIEAVKEVGISLPVVVRLAGTNAELGLAKLKQSDLKITAAEDFTAGAKAIIEAVKRGIS